MLRTGKVVSSHEGEMEVCFERPEACAHCGACGGIKHESLVKIPGDVPAGRRIDVDMPEGQVLKASALAYVLPLILLLAGIGLGSLLFQSEILWAVTGLAGMALAWAALKWADGRIRKKAGWQPRVLRVHEEEE